MEDNSVIGAARRVAGRLENSAGDVAGDVATEIRGKAREVGGLIQQGYGDATERTRTLIGSQSLTALLAAGALGLAVGFLLKRR